MERKEDPSGMKRELVARLERVARTLEQVADSYAKTMARDGIKPKRAQSTGLAKQKRRKQNRG
jgi:hypothetical protein